MIQINYVITTNKNIKCYGCVTKCEKLDSEYYVDLETFRQHMKILNNTFSEKIELHFTGGEPLLHKQLYLLCQIANEELSDLIIYIHTNGILLSTLKDDVLLDLTNNCNVVFLFYLYPLLKFFKNYQKKAERLERLNIKMLWSHEHIYFNKYSLIKDKKKCSNLLQDKKQLLIIKDKIYPLCPSIQMIQHKIIDTNINYILMDELKDVNQINNLFLNYNCSYCNGSTETSILNLYLDNYTNYELLIDYVYDLKIYLNIPFIYKNIEKTTSKKEFEAILNKYLTGWADIFIPYSRFSLTKDKILELNNLLQKQKNIEKFNLYFVAIDEDIQTQQNWFEIFETPENPLQTYFLKGKSLYLGIKKFFDNSRNKYYILDITKLKQLEDDPLFLTKIIN